MPAKSDRSVQLAGRSILVVEDEYFLAADVAGALRDLGADIVGPINDLAEAAQALLAHDLAGAALDVNVGGKAIYPVAQELAARGIPFIFMTGYGKDGIHSEYRHVTRCEKPFDPPMMALLLAELVLSREQ